MPERPDEDLLLEELTRQTNEYAVLYRRAAQDVAVVRADLEEARKSLATVAHDLRSPLAVVTGVTELLLDDPNLSSSHRRLIEGAGRATALMGELTDLLVEAIGTARAQANRVPLDLVELLELVAARHRLLVGAGGEIVLALPSSRWRPCILGDRLMLERLLDNLLNNAVKFSPAGGRVTVTIAGAPASTVQVSVADQGPGIDQDQHQAIFEAFRRAPGAEGTPGLGLGLAIVRQIADLHAATVAVRSTPGHGSVFTVTFPLLNGADGPDGGADGAAVASAVCG